MSSQHTARSATASRREGGAGSIEPASEPPLKRRRAPSETANLHRDILDDQADNEIRQNMLEQEEIEHETAIRAAKTDAELQRTA